MNEAKLALLAMLFIFIIGFIFGASTMALQMVSK